MDFNGLKDKVLSTLGQASDSARDLAGKASGGAKEFAGKAAGTAKAGGRIAKLSMEAAQEREEIKKTYQEIGKLYYETHQDAPEGFFIQLFEEVRVSEESIAAKEAELAALKGEFKEGIDLSPIIKVEFDKEEDADFSEVVDKVEAEAEAVAEAVKEKAEEVKDAVEEKVEEIKDHFEE